MRLRTSLHLLNRGFRFMVLALVCTPVAGPALLAQQPVTGGETFPGALNEPVKILHTSSQGVAFSTIPGTPVLFAQWETRVSDFETFVRESGHVWNQKAPFPQSADHPVVNVNLQDALAYCTWLTEKERKVGAIKDTQTYRLPTSEEWSAAVGLEAGRRLDLVSTQRVADKQAFPWGLEWPPPVDGGNFNSQEISGASDGFVYTAPVGSYRPSAEGLFDLGGNVWEWTWNEEIRSDTQGILRGGSWMYFVKDTLLSAYEYRVPGDLRAPSIGFRCVLEDKRRTGAYLAMVGKATEEASKAKREELTTAPMVSEEEVRKMREQMSSRASAGPEVVLPDPKTLKPAAAGLPFTNSLGMNLAPLPGRNVLLGTTETRVQDYQQALAAQGKAWANRPTFAFKDNHPLMNVSWQEAVAFCNWLTEKDRSLQLIPATAKYRLPTDEEWSLAVGLAEERGATPAEKHLGNKTDFPWGLNAIPQATTANLDSTQMKGYQDNFSYTAPVGSFPANKFGFFDLGGNVAEWCQDSWLEAGSGRTVRGSSWLSSSQESLLSSFRLRLPEESIRPHVGFRVALEMDAP